MDLHKIKSKGSKRVRYNTPLLKEQLEGVMGTFFNNLELIVKGSGVVISPYTKQSKGKVIVFGASIGPQNNSRIVRVNPLPCKDVYERLRFDDYSRNLGLRISIKNDDAEFDNSYSIKLWEGRSG